MSELSTLELDVEQADLLPERETLSVFGLINGGHNHVSVTQVAVASAHGLFALAAANNVAIVNVG